MEKIIKEYQEPEAETTEERIMKEFGADDPMFQLLQKEIAPKMSNKQFRKMMEEGMRAHEASLQHHIENAEEAFVMHLAGEESLNVSKPRLNPPNFPAPGDSTLPKSSSQCTPKSN
jgi:hypothetical protein